MLRDPSLIPLSHQHHNGLALCVMTRRSLAADSSAQNVAKLARRAIDRYELELVNHFEIEEQVLFPACGPMPLIAELIAEHRMMEGLIAQLRTAPTARAAGGVLRAALEPYQTRRERTLRRNSAGAAARSVGSRGQRDRSAGRADLSVNSATSPGRD